MSTSLVEEKAVTPASVVAKYFPRVSGVYLLLVVRVMGKVGERRGHTGARYIRLQLLESAFEEHGDTVPDEKV